MDLLLDLLQSIKLPLIRPLCEITLYQYPHILIRRPLPCNLGLDLRRIILHPLNSTYVKEEMELPALTLLDLQISVVR